jgi:hypothetical protein
VSARSVSSRTIALTIVLVVVSACGRIDYQQRIGDGSVGDVALSDGALVDGALADGALADGALADGSTGDASLDGGFRPVATLYISPSGDDASPGTREQPLKTFSYALSRLAPGSLLVVLPGGYGLGTETGYLDADCRATGTACEGAPCSSGEVGLPIVVRAENERTAVLTQETGAAVPPILIRSCTDWVVEGLTAVGIDDATGSGFSTVAIFGGGRVTLRRLLAVRHNRYFNTNVINVSYGSDVLIEECEVYEFSAPAIQIWQSSDVVVRRSYAHQRGLMNLPGGHPGSFDWAEQALALSGSPRALAENNVFEGDLFDGIKITGTVDGPAGAADDNRLLGNVVLLGTNGEHGVDVRSDCGGASPCTADDMVASRATLIDNVSIGGSNGITARGVEDLSIRGFTAHLAPITIDTVAYNSGLVRRTVALENVLLVGSPSAGLSVTEQTEWSVDYANAFVAGAAFLPAGDPGFMNISLDDPMLGGCLVYIPAGSPMRGRGAGGADIGANVVFRYQDGVLGTERLWDVTTGRFPCGATISGINDAASFPTASCVTVHQRLNVGAGGCAIP